MHPITVMTSNHPEKLDAAIKNPGRCDLQVELGYCTKESDETDLSNTYIRKSAALDPSTRC